LRAFILKHKEMHPSAPRALFFGAVCGLAACFLSLGLYGHRLILSGDQSIQLVAAESILAGEGLKVPPPSLSGEVRLEAAFDLREKLAWYPPGYSALLALLVGFGLPISAAALAIYLVNTVVSCALWSAVVSRFGVPFWVVGAVFFFQSAAFMPATTTDQLLWPIVAAMFLLAGRQATWSATLLVTVLFCLAIWIRWFGVIFPLIWAAWSLAGSFPRLPGIRGIFLACFPLAISLLFYLSLLAYLSGSADPYNLPASQETNWWLLPKAFYFAVTGGMSSMSAPLQAGFALVAILAVVGIARSAFDNPHSVPRWIIYLGLFQAIILLFLVYMQMKNSAAFMINAPAFAIPRFYSLAQPLSLGFILAGLGALCRKRWSAAAASAGLLLLVVLSAAHYVVANKQKAHLALTTDHRGLLRPAKFVELEKMLKESQPDLVLFKNDWREVAASFDSWKVLPYHRSIENDASGWSVIVVE